VFALLREPGHSSALTLGGELRHQWSATSLVGLPSPEFFDPPDAARRGSNSPAPSPLTGGFFDKLFFMK
jgi:hypothetical protein